MEKNEIEKNVNEIYNFFKKNKGACIIYGVSKRKRAIVESVYGNKQDVLALITSCLHELLKNKEIDKNDIELVYKVAIEDYDFVSKQLQEGIENILKGLKDE